MKNEKWKMENGKWSIHVYVVKLENNCKKIVKF